MSSEEFRQEEEFLEKLPKDGSPIGNKSLAKQLRLIDSSGLIVDEYWTIRDVLLVRGQVGIGRGRGGSVFRKLDVHAKAFTDDDNIESLQEFIPSVTESGSVSDAELAGGQLLNIDSIRIKNFKIIEDIVLDLSPITILVGGNGSGKSSVLQATHAAINCLQLYESVRKESGPISVPQNSLTYSPVNDFSHVINEEMDYGSHSEKKSIVEFYQDSKSPEEKRNLIVGMKPDSSTHSLEIDVDTSLLPALYEQISDAKNLFSVYVPGLAGVIKEEEWRSYGNILYGAAGGEANTLFRNIVALLIKDGKAQFLVKYLKQVLGYPVTVKLTSSSETDRFIEIHMAKGTEPSESDYRPIEVWSTGILQIVQLLAYTLLFEPNLLLLDEPDSHVHSKNQTQLMRVLETIAQNSDCKIIIATHSASILEAAAKDTKVVWLREGKSKNGNADDMKILMDLGVLSESVPEFIIYTEDEDSQKLRLAFDAADCGTFEIRSMGGVENMIKAVEITKGLHGNFKFPQIIVHRDRDCMTEDELAQWVKNIGFEPSAIFCPKLCDVESYHATASHIADVAGINLETAKKYRTNCLKQNKKKLRQKFESKRQEALSNKNIIDLYKEGGSPKNDTLWQTENLPPEEFIYGKDFLGQLKSQLQFQKVLTDPEMLETTVSRDLVEEIRVFIQNLKKR